MKKTLLISVILLIIFSCSKENIDNNENHVIKGTGPLVNDVLELNLDSIANMNAGAFLKSDLLPREKDSITEMGRIEFSRYGNSHTIAGEEYTDVTGFIHLRIFWAQSPYATHFPHAEVEVSDDYVVVGGGARTTNNQYLYESRPDDQLTKWIASSKDHMFPNLHYVTAYAIGMKIDGVTSEYLRSKIHLYSSTSTQPVNHPDWTVTIPSNLLLLGGGAHIHWDGYGNMLTASYPISSTQWRAMGKDHRRADPSKITAYAIGIENISYPNVGYLQVSAVCTSEYIPDGSCKTTSVDIPTGWGLTCSAGKVTYNSMGRLITDNYPYTITRSLFRSCHNTYYDTGYNYSWALIIQGGI